MAEELIKAESQVPELAVQFEETEDPSVAVVISLPDYDTCSEQKVLNTVKSTFKGFDASVSGDALHFDSTDALADYTLQTLGDIQRIRKTTEASQLNSKAAVMARFWYLGVTINEALAKGNYGTNAVNRLASAMQKSISYIYQIKNVATKLTVIDCYLLGMRGVDTTHLRKLATVKDDAIRRGIIDSFIREYKDTSDERKMDAAKKQLVASINKAINGDAIDVATSDPVNGGSEVFVSEEYTNAWKTLKGFKGLMKKLSDPNAIRLDLEALGNFFITSETPKAEERLDDIQELAEQVKAMVDATKLNLDEIKTEIDSFLNVGVED